LLQNYQGQAGVQQKAAAVAGDYFHAVAAYFVRSLVNAYSGHVSPLSPPGFGFNFPALAAGSAGFWLVQERV
jgi:hypothetical protein